MPIPISKRNMKSIDTEVVLNFQPFYFFIYLFNVIFKEGSPFQLKTAFQRSPLT